MKNIGIMGKIQKQNRLMLEYGGRQYMTRTFKMEDGGTAVVAGLELLDILQPRPMEGGDDGFRDDGARRLYEKIDYFFDDGSLAVLTLSLIHI